MVATRDMFSDAEGPQEIAERLERYKALLSKAIDNPVAVERGEQPRSIRKVGPSRSSQLKKSIASGELLKAGASPETIASLQAELQKTSPTSDIQIGSPTDLWAYDLEAPAKELKPFETPLRNRTPRKKGVGTAHQWRTITAITGSGTGGLGLINPGITESTTNTFGPGDLALARGPKIEYAGGTMSVPYLTFSMSTDVTWESYFAGVGFQDQRQLAATSLLQSSMSMEEHMLLGARGTASGFAGALAAPTATAAPRSSLTAGEVGCSSTIVTLYIAVTAVAHWGESAPTLITIGSSAVVSGDVVDVSITDVPGALGYHVYIGTSNTPSGGFYTGLFDAAVSGPVAAPGVAGVQPGLKSGKLTINFTGAGTAGVPNAGAHPATTDGTANANNYDGLLTYCTGADAGYVTRVNNTFAGADGTNVGNTFGEAFYALYASVKANPDEMFANGQDRKQVSDQLKTQGSSAYRLNLTAAEAGAATIGSIVNAVYNPVTGKEVALTVHPWLDQGTMPIVSWNLNLPNSNVSDVFSVFNVQDYLGVNWPAYQFLYESSSYWQGTYCCFAPAWCGAIQGIWKA